MHVEVFSTWLFAEGKVVKTIESYMNDVTGFEKYLQEKLMDVPVLSRFSFERYLSRKYDDVIYCLFPSR
ncbi:hypothetical protein [Bacillus sp. CECT 9360]|uniref:hypothetical protein n=1 Tax=Bacillus sp. CECT 9360 TaxID=2845821 RepID=UPI001E624E47|nr:hypothetical protein [Bacillus sp. CECT 9360]CAH0345149.1 hypothetical protein BCI9360_01428 [Bacillus sp. CECT 9360]